MGLLDWTASDEELFPNFDNAVVRETKHTRSDSHSSTTSSTSTASSANSNAAPAPRRRRSPSFDLFGDDEELQLAESSIGFCDICMKHCAVH